jgi:tetratricopeptide (TPR) repeat protein
MMAPVLYWYYEIRDDYAAALSSYQVTLEQLRAAGAPGNLASPKERLIFAYLMSQLPWFQFRAGNTEAALALFAESLELASSHADLNDTSDQEAVYHIYVNWGYLALLSGDMAGAEQMTRKGLAIAQAIRSPWHLAIASTILGILELQQGNLAKAVPQLTDSLAIWREVGDLRGVTFCMIYLGSAALASGSAEKAEAILLESYAKGLEMMDRWAQAFSLDMLGQISTGQGKLETAVDRFQRSFALSEEIGDSWAANQTLIRLAQAQAAIQFNAQARALFQKAYFNAQQAHWPLMIVEVLLAYSTLSPNLPPETKLAIAHAILSCETITLDIRQRAAQLREAVLAVCPASPVENALESAGEKSAEMWAQEVFESAFIASA